VAAARGARVEEGPWYIYPRLVLPLLRATLELSCMHAGDEGRRTRTFAWAGSEEYGEFAFELRRAPARGGVLEGLGWHRTETGERAFDSAFWTDDPAACEEVLDAELRAALLRVDPSVRVRLVVGVAARFRDGRFVAGESVPRLEVSILRVPPSVEDVEALCDVAVLAHTRLVSAELRLSA
jgi:hypothetical protein